MNATTAYRISAAVLAMLLCTAGFAAADRPNVLWISCEDIGPHLQSYGYEHARTPALDRLATQGVRYTRAFTTTPVCATNRSSIITGVYPTTIGAHFMRCEATLPAQVRCFTEQLREAGYYCTNNNKEDYNFAPPDSAWDESSPQAHWRTRPAGRPFFAVFNLKQSHESKVWPRGDAHRKHCRDLTADDMQDPLRLSPPPYYPDTPEVRRDWANYYENITQVDYLVAGLLDQLKDDGLADDTIVFFWSDHGAGLPRAKRWLYDSGTRVPLIVAVPDQFREAAQVRPGAVSDELVCSVDLPATVLNLAGVTIPGSMQGRAFLGRNLTPEREYVIGVRDRMDERYDIIRSVRDRRYRYLRNYMPWKPYAQDISFAEANETMRSLRRAAADGSLPAAAELFMSECKPAEELYDTQEDPHELNNLAGSSDPQNLYVLDLMRERLARWEASSRDLGLIPESRLRELEAEVGTGFQVGARPQTQAMLARVREMLDPRPSDEHRFPLLRECVGAERPTVRYWAATLLAYAASAPEHGRHRDEVEQLLTPLLADNDAAVRLAAANGLCLMGDSEASLQVLVEGLGHESKWIRLAAATYLDELAPNNRAVVEQLEKAGEASYDRYVQRVAWHALHRIDGRPLPRPWPPK